MNMASGDCWNKNRIRHEMITEKKLPNPIREMRQAKAAAQDAIADLLELLPEGDVRVGMVRLLGEWTQKEIDTIPDDLHWVDDANDD